MPPRNLALARRVRRSGCSGSLAVAHHHLITTVNMFFGTPDPTPRMRAREGEARVPAVQSPPSSDASIPGSLYFFLRKTPAAGPPFPCPLYHPLLGQQRAVSRRSVHLGSCDWERTEGCASIAQHPLHKQLTSKRTYPHIRLKVSTPRLYTIDTEQPPCVALRREHRAPDAQRG